MQVLQPRKILSNTARTEINEVIENRTTDQFEAILTNYVDFWNKFRGDKGKSNYKGP